MSRALRLVPAPASSSVVEHPWRDCWLEFECWLISNTIDRSPVVVVRRTTIE